MRGSMRWSVRGPRRCAVAAALVLLALTTAQSRADSTNTQSPFTNVLTNLVNDVLGVQQYQVSLPLIQVLYMIIVIIGAFYISSINLYISICKLASYDANLQHKFVRLRWRNSCRIIFDYKIVAVTHFGWKFIFPRESAKRIRLQIR